MRDCAEHKVKRERPKQELQQQRRDLRSPPAPKQRHQPKPHSPRRPPAWPPSPRPTSDRHQLLAQPHPARALVVLPLVDAVVGGVVGRQVGADAVLHLVLGAPGWGGVSGLGWGGGSVGRFEQLKVLGIIVILSSR